MNRRQLLTGLAGLGLTGGSLWVAQNGLHGAGSGESTLSVEVETIDAPGSQAGTTTIPRPGTVTVLDLFATWCAPCKAQMSRLATVHEEYADRVAFVSVTNEKVGETLTREEVADWWRRYEGDWTVGFDTAGDIHAAVGAQGIPYTVVFDESGAIQARHNGVTTVDDLRADIDGLL